MDLLGDLGMEDQLTSVRSENAVLQQRVKELLARVQRLTVENESLKAEVELYRDEMALPNFSELALGPDSSSSTPTMTTMTTKDDPFVRAGNGVYPQKNDVTLRQLHAGNNLCCALSTPDDVILASGGADAKLRLLPWGLATVAAMEEVAVQTAASISCPAPVIAVAFSPILRQVLAVGCMDGSVALVQYQQPLRAGTTTWSTSLKTSLTPVLPKKHTKYVRNIVWSPIEPLFASTSADGCIYVYKVEKQMNMMDDDDNGDDDDNAMEELVQATLVESLHLSGAIEACCFVQHYLVCYVRGTHHLTYFDLAKEYQQTKINLNQDLAGGSAGFSEHVSFAILDLKPSPCGCYLAAATDMSRNLVLDVSTGRVLKNLYGHQNDVYSQPKIAWSRSGQYLLGNTQDEAVICVWDIASQQIVQKLGGTEKQVHHQSPIRDLVSATSMDCLVTTAFDKSTRLWFVPESTAVTV